MDAELTDDAIAGEWRVWQRRRGHRFSIDDVATAWEAVRACPNARRCLDLGCGLGSVLLMVAYKLEAATLVGVEAQDVSFELARRNVDRNGLSTRITLLHGDLRALDLGALGPFELITGTPPYFPPGTALLSPDPQRAHARAELRGGVEDYVRAGARWLADDGRLVLCADARRPERVLTSAEALGLAVRTRRDLVPRAGKKGALFSLWVLGRVGANCPPPRVETPFVARDEEGRRTAEASELRRFFGIPPRTPGADGRP